MPRNQPGAQRNRSSRGSQKDAPTESSTSEAPAPPRRNPRDQSPLRNISEGERFLAKVDQIAPNPRNVREEWEWGEDEFEDFTGNVEKHKVLQDPTVIARVRFEEAFPEDAKELPEEALWVLAMGERRWRAVRRLGQKDLPVVLHSDAVEAMDEVIWSENQARRGLDPIQEGTIFKRFRDKGLTAVQIAVALGKRSDRELSGTEISKKIKLLQLKDGPARRAIRKGKLGVDPAYQLVNKLGSTTKVNQAWALMEEQGIGWQKALEQIAPGVLEPKRQAKVSAPKASPNSAAPEARSDFSPTKTEPPAAGPTVPPQSGPSGEAAGSAEPSARRNACARALAGRSYGRLDPLSERLSWAVIMSSSTQVSQLALELLESSGVSVPVAPYSDSELAQVADAMALASSELRAGTRACSDWDKHDVRYIHQLVAEGDYSPSSAEDQAIKAFD